MNLQNMVKEYKEKKELISKYEYAIFIMEYDADTDCPTKDKERSYEVQNFFRQKVLDIQLNEDYINLIKNLYCQRNKLDKTTKLNIEIEHKNLERTLKVPKGELISHLLNISRSLMAWENAKKSLDYSIFLKEMETNVDYYKKYEKWQETDKIKGFDVLIDEKEEGFTEKKYNKFFDLVEKELVPFVNKILKCPKKYNPKLDTLSFPMDKQKHITEKIAKIMGYDSSVGCIRETVHPFCGGANANDVRIATVYNEKSLFSNLYSIMHEIGHALYRLQMDPKYNGTNIFNNVTYATDESQSRFYENYIGRSRGFVEYIYPILQQEFPTELQGITVDDVYYYVNSVNAQLYRMEADELTYPIHILIRYKIEKMLFHNKITVYDIDKTFNKLMKKYLHIGPKNMKEGCFQDQHWAQDFAYFPTYALGSAFGAQIYKAMGKDLDIYTTLKNGEMSKVNLWLKEHIHKYSGTIKNIEMIKKTCNEEFDPKVYIKYLKEKFSSIYSKN